jgi:hypothetical protein
VNVAGKELRDELNDDDDDDDEFRDIENDREQNHVQKAQPRAFAGDVVLGLLIDHG